MSDQPDLSTSIPQRMREAADVLDQVNALERQFGTDHGSWTADQLRNRAADWQDWQTGGRLP